MAPVAGTSIDRTHFIALRIPMLHVQKLSVTVAGTYSMFIKIEHPHKCRCLAVAPAMGEGREWKVGVLTEHLQEYPVETHCLHLKTQYKDITFLCNEADFRQLMILCRAVIPQPSENWLNSMVEMGQKIANATTEDNVKSLYQSLLGTEEWEKSQLKADPNNEFIKGKLHMLEQVIVGVQQYMLNDLKG